HTAVLTIGQFNAGTAFNIIADEAELIGTVRFFDLDIQEQIINEMQQIIDGMKKTHNIEIIFDYQKGHPPVVNHAQATYHVLNAARQINDVNEANEVMPQMEAEDFAYYLHYKLGAFFFTCAHKTDNAFTHNPPMLNINERALTNTS